LIIILRFILIKNNKKNICVAPGSVRKTKKLPTNKYIEIINNLTDYNIYLIGANNEKIICDEILYNVSHENIVNFAGEFNLLESAELIKHSDLLLCNDSAPLHIGNAVDTPVFAFFGPTVKRFGCYPYREKDQMIEVDLDCRPCGKHGSNKCPLGHHRCMNDIKVEDVINKVNNLLG
jgi:heptosyltransferase-2